MTRLPIVLVVAAMGCGAEATFGVDQTADWLEAGPPSGVAGIHWARNAAPSRPGGGSANLVYHGGPVMTAGATVEAIFWGTSWGDSSFIGDKMSGLQSFYGGMGGSPYDATTSEYTDFSGAHVGSGVSLTATHIDLLAAPRNGNKTSPILEEACSRAATLRADGYYPVYVDTPRGHAGFCAWHSAGTCPNGAKIQFAFFFNLDGDAACDPQDTSGLHSPGMAALANVSGHELSEALTDPHLDAWLDSSGAENADKCAWVFGTPLVTFSNHSQWKIQGNWSNAAFNAGTGYANSSDQNGCLDGGNFR